MSLGLSRLPLRRAFMAVGDWTAKKVWSGVDVLTDHAIR